MSEESGIKLTLTRTQISQVVRHARRRRGLASMLPDIEDAQALHDTVAPLLKDDTYSRSTLRALLVLAAFQPYGAERGLTEVARELELSPSTAHRYIVTWMALGLLEQHPTSRRYRRRIPTYTPAEPGDLQA